MDGPILVCTGVNILCMYGPGFMHLSKVSFRVRILSRLMAVVIQPALALLTFDSTLNTPRII
jgi:hypothetical protein